MKLGIIAAMDIEAARIMDRMEGMSARKIGGITYHTGKIGKCNVVCAVCGIGKVAAAMCAEGMIIGFSPDYVINTGIAGSLSEKLGIGDIAVSSAVVEHDMDTSPLGDPPGFISGPDVIEMPASEKLVSEIFAIADGFGIRHLMGVIASGDRFIADQESKKRIRDLFGAVACEMEGAAVGHVCHVNGIPFAVIRAVSDSADGDATEDYPSFARRSAEVSANIAVELALRLSGKKSERKK